MGRICHARNCFSKSKQKEDNVQFHKIPSDPGIRKKWIEICQVPSKFHSFKTLHICSKHFKSSAYCLLGTKTMLKKDAVPSALVFKYASLEKFRFTEKKLANQNDKENEDGTTIIENQKGANQINESDSLIKVESSKLDKSVREELESIGNTYSSNISDIKSKPIADDVNQKFDTVIAHTETDTLSEEDQIKYLVEKEERIIDMLKAANVKIEIPIALKFTVGQLVELDDYDDKWYTGVILQIDDDENEIFVEFEKNSMTRQQWIRMDSNRLRMYEEKSFSEHSKQNDQSEENTLNDIKEKPREKTFYGVEDEQEDFDEVEEEHEESDGVEEEQEESDGVEEEQDESSEFEEFAGIEEKEKMQNENLDDKEDLYTIVKIPIFIGQKIELSDFHNWYSAVIEEIDYKEKELLLKYEKNFKNHVEWIPMNSKRIRVTDESQTVF